MPPLVRVVVCRCCHRELYPIDSVSRLLERLRAWPGPLLEVEDLCDLVRKKDPVLAELAASDRLVVIACHPRTVWSLFAASGTALPEPTRVLDLRARPVEEVLAEVGLADAVGADAEAERVQDSVPASASEDAWFPVIDRGRCIDCGKCLDFCLFGVYSRSPSGTVAAVNPSACKPNCPACARICPENAIIFPKSPDEAINGAELDAEALKDARIRLSPEDMLRGDVYARLKARTGGTRPPLYRPGVAEGDDPQTGEAPDNAARNDPGRAGRRGNDT